MTGILALGVPTGTLLLDESTTDGAAEHAQARAHRSACDPAAIRESFVSAIRGCRAAWRDTGRAADPGTHWGFDSHSCVIGAPRPRITRLRNGGDGRSGAGKGGTPPDHYSRRLTVFDGDAPSGASGSPEERCELGLNYHAIPNDPRPSSPTVLYRNGHERITVFSLYLPRHYPLWKRRWQVVMQMKQASPSDLSASGTAAGLSPALTLDAEHGHWRIVNNWNRVWSAPAKARRWTRFVIDAYYTNAVVRGVPKGWLRAYVDLNGDGDVADRGEAQRAIKHIPTLKTEIVDPGLTGDAGDTDGIRAGQAIPSHLRMGLYHDPSIPCPQPTGCSIQIDNVAVLKVPNP